MKTKNFGKEISWYIEGGDGIDGESGPVQRHSACRVIKEHERPGLLTDLRQEGRSCLDLGPLKPWREKEWPGSLPALFFLNGLGDSPFT